jgi:prophage maintenance system killer protein
MYSLAQNHPFVDGNKRTALVAAGKVDVEEIAAWL